MGMNDVLDAMVAFRSALAGFTEVLAHSAQQQQTAEQNLAQLWDDDFARQFRSQYEELNQPVLEFRQDADSKLIPFVDGKIHEIRRFLDHG
jgi:hypothetical protein